MAFWGSLILANIALFSDSQSGMVAGIAWLVIATIMLICGLIL